MSDTQMYIKEEMIYKKESFALLLNTVCSQFAFFDKFRFRFLHKFRFSCKIDSA